jgi:hypothetical protein
LRLIALTLVFALILSSCGVLGSNPKGLAKDTVDWLLDLGAALNNPLKYPGSLAKAASLGVKVGKLSERDRAIYNEELGRIVGLRAADILTILRRDEMMSALLSSEGMGALLDSMGLGELAVLVRDERMPGFLADAGAALASGPVATDSAIDSDIVLGGFLSGLFGGASSSSDSSSSVVPEETKDSSGGIMGFIGGLFGGSKSAAPEETKDSGGVFGFLAGLFGGGSSSSGSVTSNRKPAPLAANATHKQALAKYDEMIAYIMNNPIHVEGVEITTLEKEMLQASYKSYRGVLQLAGLAWSNKEARDDMIDLINGLIAELE